jgi:hypothetical protein
VERKRWFRVGSVELEWDMDMDRELLRGYHSSSSGGVIYYMYNTSTPF